MRNGIPLAQKDFFIGQPEVIFFKVMFSETHKKDLGLRLHKVSYHTCLAPFYLALELSLLLGPVQTQKLHSRGPICVAHLANFASLALCKQEKH